MQVIRTLYNGQTNHQKTHKPRYALLGTMDSDAIIALAAVGIVLYFGSDIKKVTGAIGNAVEGANAPTPRTLSQALNVGEYGASTIIGTGFQAINMPYRIAWQGIRSIWT